MFHVSERADGTFWTSQFGSIAGNYAQEGGRSLEDSRVYRSAPQGCEGRIYFGKFRRSSASVGWQLYNDKYDR